MLLYLHIYRFKGKNKVFILQNIPQPSYVTISTTLIGECPLNHKLEHKKKHENGCVALLGSSTLLCKKLLHSHNWEKEFDKLINLSFFFFFYSSASATQIFLLLWSSVYLWCWQKHNPEALVTFRRSWFLCWGHWARGGTCGVVICWLHSARAGTRSHMLLNHLRYLWYAGSSKAGLRKLSVGQDWFIIFQSQNKPIKKKTQEK